MKIKAQSKKVSRWLMAHQRPVLIALGILLLSTSAVAAGWVYKDQLFPTSAVAVEISPSLDSPTFHSVPSLTWEVNAKLETPKENQKAVLASLVVDNATIKTQELLLTQDSQIIPFTYELATASEGEHQVAVEIKDTDGKTVWQKSGKIIKDTQSPTLTDQVSTPSAITKVTIATSSGQIKIFDTKPVELSVTLPFSEAGTLVIEAVDKVSFDWTQEPTANPTFHLPANQAPFTTSYTFTDLAGHQLKGELSYYYDNKPPTFTIKSALTMTDKWGKSYALTFNPSEATNLPSVTFKGQTLEVYKHTLGYYVAKTTLEYGDNVFTITATDTNGNKGTQSVTVVLTKDPNPVSLFSSSSKNFRPCTQELRNQCRDKTGYTFSAGSDCSLFWAYVDCLKPLCDSTTAHNICGDSRNR